MNDNSIAFVEFKNGRVKNQNVKNKLRDSLLIFLDVTGKTISYTRKHADFIVVYNAEENSGAVKQKQKELASFSFASCNWKVGLCKSEGGTCAFRFRKVRADLLQDSAYVFTGAV